MQYITSKKPKGRTGILLQKVEAIVYHKQDHIYFKDYTNNLVLERYMV